MGPHIDRGVAAGQTDYRNSLQELDGSAFGARLARCLTVYDPAVTSVQFNLIGSHDAPRARSVLGEDLTRLGLAQLLLLTLPGTPSIYYGDELGMSGHADPDCRRAYPASLEALGDAERAHRARVRAQVHARRAHVALRRGEAHVISSNARGDRSSSARRTVSGRSSRSMPATSRSISRSRPAAFDGLRALDALGIGSAEVRPEADVLAMGPRSAIGPRRRLTA